MKGLRKGFKYFSHMFDDDKEPEIQIGLPTDVKHVAHIGWDGPSAVESPSWMKEFNGDGGGFQSAPIAPPGGSMGNPEVKWVSEDGKGRRKKDMPELPKSSRRTSSNDSTLSAGSPGRESTSRTKHSKRHQSKDSTDSIRSEQSSRNLPDIPKKSKKKKSKESKSKGHVSSRGSDDISHTYSMESVDSDASGDKGYTSGIY